MVQTEPVQEKQDRAIENRDRSIFAVWVLFVRTIPQHGIDGYTALELGQMFDAAYKEAKERNSSDGAWFIDNVSPFLRQFAYVSDFYYVTMRKLANLESQPDTDMRELDSLRSRHQHVLLSIAEMVCELAMPDEPFYNLAMFPAE